MGPLEKRRQKSLPAMLKARGLSTSGDRRQLQERLECTHFATGPAEGDLNEADETCESADESDAAFHDDGDWFSDHEGARE